MGKQIDPAKTSSTASRHLRWESFETRIGEGPPSLEPIAGSPKVVLFIAPGGTQIGVRLYASNVSSVTSPLAEVAIRKVGTGKQGALEVSTGNPILYRDFYAFCCTIADRVQLDRQPVGQALAETLSSWSALIRRKALLSEERQVGLSGELLFLARAAKHLGWVAAVAAWQGPYSEEHDFTLPRVDVEVKTTRGERRLHQIGSLTQLLPKSSRELFVVSIQITPSTGKGSFSLAHLVANVLGKATVVSHQLAEDIRQQLTRQGWADDDTPQYSNTYQVRVPMCAVAVDVHFPAIVPDTLATLGTDLITRIERLSYAVNLDGLGALDQANVFEKLLFRQE